MQMLHVNMVGSINGAAIRLLNNVNAIVNGQLSIRLAVSQLQQLYQLLFCHLVEIYFQLNQLFLHQLFLHQLQ